MTTGQRLGHGGSATLLVLLSLLLGLSTAVLWSHRGQLAEQRSAADQARATAALHAAQAGLDWGLAQLHRRTPLDGRCAPDLSSTTSWRQRYLGLLHGERTITPLGSAEAGCLHDGSGWTCACPASAGSRAFESLTAPTDGQEHPGFLLRWETVATTGAVTLVSTGCLPAGPACSGTDGSAWPAASARARLRLDHGLLGTLRRWPLAPVSAAGRVTLGPAVEVVQPDATWLPGWTVAAGGAVVLEPGARLSSVAHAGTDSARAQLPGLSGDLDTWLRRHVGLPIAWLRRLPSVTTLDCSQPCSGATLAAAWNRERPVLVIRGDATLDDQAPRGSLQQPLVLLVDGTLSAQTSGAWHGLIVARAVQWQAGNSSGLDGALLSAGDLRLDGPLTVRASRAVLEQAGDSLAALVPLAGGWRDHESP